MSPRPRIVENDAILDATELAMADHGPTTFSLDDVAGRLRVTAQAVLRRFGSKHALVLAVSERRSRRASDAVTRRDGVSPLGAMCRFFQRRMRGRAYDAKQVLGAFAFNLSGLGDDAVRPSIVRQVAAVRANLESFVSAAIRAGELHGDAASIAQLIEAVYNGTVYLWLVDGRGTAWSYFQPQLEALLAPYRKAPPRRRRNTRTLD